MVNLNVIQEAVTILDEAYGEDRVESDYVNLSRIIEKSKGVEVLLFLSIRWSDCGNQSKIKLE